MPDACRVGGQGRRIVGRVVGSRRAVQPEVAEQAAVSRGLVATPPGRRVRGDAGDAVRGQLRARGPIEPVRMPRLECDGTAMPALQQFEESRDAPVLVNEAGWQLHQQAAQPGAERRHLREECIQWFVDVPQPALVRDDPRQLDREPEPGGHACGPAGIGGRPMRPVEARIDLDRAEYRAIALEVRTFRRERIGHGTGDRPARTAEVDTAWPAAIDAGVHRGGHGHARHQATGRSRANSHAPVMFPSEWHEWDRRGAEAGVGRH